jgi:hypothetical protein
MNGPALKALKTSHQQLLLDINRLLDVLRDYPKALSILSDFEKVFTEYLRLQDSRLYDVLRQYYRMDREALKMLEFLEQDLKDIKIEFWNFLEGCSPHANAVAVRNFPKRFSDLSKKVISRIAIEEEYLFPLLNHKKFE